MPSVHRYKPLRNSASFDGVKKHVNQTTATATIITITTTNIISTARFDDWTRVITARKP
jgi:hypothetical protein